MEDDKKIVEQVLAGDVNLFGVLVNKYQNPIFRVILKIVGDYENAKEVTQDVFLRTYESLNKYNPKYKFFSWLYRIAINNALMYVRKKKNTISIDQIDSNYFVSKENLTSKKEGQYKILNESLVKLPEKYKIIIILKYYAEQSYSEIAEITGIDEKKVKSRLFDGRKLLKSEMINTNFFTPQ